MYRLFLSSEDGKALLSLFWVLKKQTGLTVMVKSKTTFFPEHLWISTEMFTDAGLYQILRDSISDQSVREWKVMKELSIQIALL